MENSITIDAIISPPKFSSPGQMERRNLYDTEDKPKSLYHPVSPIHNLEDTPELIKNGLNGVNWEEGV